ncbi:MAG TPA: UDP-N-acetylmuramoyl-tripeptide--D-alanyl-D-alanine ligase [Candidatus Paceibacterota bacterium]|nr:UDP-N-acetylmuramoyl-tripeptide--D-alanyl-D-alanine ligase [Candidatus Paceibacterota bacterium]
MRLFLKKIVAKALTWEARLVIGKYKPRIVAITGSVGKTSTKDAIYSVVAGDAYARKSEKSFNSEIGLPLTVLGQPNAWSNPLRWFENLFDGFLLWILPKRYPAWLVLEVGADRPGDIRSLAHWLPVDIAVVTRLPEVPVHVEFFESVEALKEEKASLIKAVKPGGALVLYADDPEVVGLRNRAPGAHIITFGFVESADVRATNVEIIFADDKKHVPTGMQARIEVEGASQELVIRGAIGAHALLPALAAVAVGKALAKDIKHSLEALKGYEPPHGRMHLVEGLKETLIIDDTYNSSPAAAEAALEALALVSHGRKIAVLGDMLELGRHSVDEHRKVGAHAAKVADLLITVGFRARDIAQGALDNGMADQNILQFEEAGPAGKELEGRLQKGDIVLVKGSQSMRMENIVEEIMLHPEQASDLLVRQDEEWKKR